MGDVKSKDSKRRVTNAAPRNAKEAALYAMSSAHCIRNPPKTVPTWLRYSGRITRVFSCVGKEGDSIKMR